MKTEGQEVDLGGVSTGFGADAGIAHAQLLSEFAQAVVRSDAAGTEAARAALRAALGDAAFVDVAATVAAFHGFVRLADAIGIPYTTAARGEDAPDIRERAGVNAFHRVQAELAR